MYSHRRAQKPSLRGVKASCCQRGRRKSKAIAPGPPAGHLTGRDKYAIMGTSIRRGYCKNSRVMFVVRSFIYDPQGILEDNE